MKRPACWLALMGLFAGMAATPAGAQSAQPWPSKPIRVVATSGAGGLSDVFMRVLGDELHRKWGQPLVIENRPGGNFNIGARACAEAPPDGHTICIMSNESVTYNIYMYPNLPFSIEKGITPITNLFFITQGLAVGADLKVKTLDELVAHAKAKPKTLSYVAPAAPLILFMENLNRRHGIDLVRVPFKGGGDAINNILNGTTPIAFLGIGNTMTHLRAGRMNALLVDSAKRSPLFPDVPSIGEIKYEGPVTRAYFGLYAPTGVPKAILDRIAADVNEVASAPAFRDKNFTQRGLEPALNTPDAFAAFLKDDRVNARRVVEQSGLKPH